MTKGNKNVLLSSRSHIGVVYRHRKKMTNFRTQCLPSLHSCLCQWGVLSAVSFPCGWRMAAAAPMWWEPEAEKGPSRSVFPWTSRHVLQELRGRDFFWHLPEQKWVTGSPLSFVIGKENGTTMMGSSAGTADPLSSHGGDGDVSSQIPGQPEGGEKWTLAGTLDAPYTPLGFDNTSHLSSFSPIYFPSCFHFCLHFILRLLTSVSFSKKNGIFRGEGWPWLTEKKLFPLFPPAGHQLTWTLMKHVIVVPEKH